MVPLEETLVYSILIHMYTYIYSGWYNLLVKWYMHKTILVGILVAVVVIGAAALFLYRPWEGAAGTQTRHMVTVTTTATTPSGMKILTFSYEDLTVRVEIPQKEILVTGGGSTFVNPQMQAWAQKFRGVSGGYVTVNYQSIGSGAGEAKWFDRALDFGAADIPISKTTYEKLVSSRASFIQFPVIAGAVAIIYNIPEWDEARCGPLRISGDVVADIYLGKILYWDDPRIKDQQVEDCKSQLPHEIIRGIHRSDGSGTTAQFTLYLSNVSKEWREKVGAGYTVEWPRDAMGYGEGGKGNEGVSSKVKGTKYSIGYVEYSYAVTNRISMAALKNKDGFYVTPSAESVMEALRRGARDLPPPSSFWGDVPLSFINRDGEKTYPIAGLVYIFVYSDIVSNRDLAAALSAFFKWVLTEGQRPENIVVGYVPIPKELAAKAIKYIDDALKY